MSENCTDKFSGTFFCIQNIVRADGNIRLSIGEFMKLLFVSLGCDKNLVDSEEMLGLLTGNGFEIVDDETPGRGDRGKHLLLHQ